MAQDTSGPLPTSWKPGSSPENQYRRRSETPELDTSRDDTARPGRPLEVSGNNDSGTSAPFDATKMFVGGLSRSTNNESLRKYFERFGPIVNASVKMDSDTGHSRGFGFIVFQDPTSIDKVLAVPSHMLDNKLIDPKQAVPLGKRPPPASSSSSPSRVHQKQQHAVVANRIFVGGLGDATGDQLQEYFSKYGPISDIDFIHDKKTGMRKGFCFVAFEMPETAEVVTKKAFHQIGSVTVEVKPATTKEAARARWMERNAGTPYGGSSSSGGGSSGVGPGWGSGYYSYGAGYGYPSPSYGYFPSGGYGAAYGYPYSSYGAYSYQQQAAYPYGRGYGQYESSYGPMKGSQGHSQGQTQSQGQGHYHMYTQGSGSGGHSS
ncbi:heterogeneous nuclear ribonucleoprotein D-like [Corticium candelabrum]|uniref:heterogeneous nuclear ribonucleoprotein D-like n=1 Tax=Corticium candelabrum TaxID=121492 RepID=UPI002E25C175|nr:heterogeneous nuclear ribonucleoprotein D-like [Corticium candelabrum]